jgi:hypothetical protein
MTPFRDVDLKIHQNPTAFDFAPFLSKPFTEKDKLY